MVVGLCTVFRLPSVHFVPEPDPSTSASPSSSEGYPALGVDIDFLRRVEVPPEARGLGVVSGNGSGLRILLGVV